MTLLKTEVDSFFLHHLEMAPIRIELELTEACTLDCQFCYNTLQPNNISKSDALRILTTLSEQGVLEIVLTGGEPLLHPDFFEISTNAAELFPNVMLQTNGVLLDMDGVRRLKDSGFLGLNISLHGPPHIHDSLTNVEGSYEKALSAIHLALDESLVTWVNTVLTSINKDSLSQHLHILKDAGVRNFTFTRFTPVGCGKDRLLGLTVRELTDVIRTIDEFKRMNQDCSVLVANAIPSCALPNELKGYSEICSYGISRFYVDVNANLMMCGMSRASMGNVLENSILDLKSNSSHFKAMCTKEALPSKCTNCKEAWNCRGGCRAAAIATSGKINGEDPLSTNFSEGYDL